MNEQIKPNNETKEQQKKEMISYSEVDQNGVFRETYGYVEKRNYNKQTFEERIKEMSEKIKKR